jgi:hypothetical protein
MAIGSRSRFLLAVGVSSAGGRGTAGLNSTRLGQSANGRDRVAVPIRQDA